MRSVFGLALAVAVHALALGLLRGRTPHRIAVEFEVRPARGAVGVRSAPAAPAGEAPALKAPPRRVREGSPRGPQAAPTAQVPGAASGAAPAALDPGGPPSAPAGKAPLPDGLRCPAWAPCQRGPSTAGSAGAAERDLQAQLLSRIAAHRRYPELARRRGIEGTVELRFAIRPDGQLAYVEISRSVDPSLDEAARQALLQAAPLPVVAGPRTVSVQFRLHDGDGEDAER